MIDLVTLRNACEDPYHLVKSKDGTELFVREWTSPQPSTTAFLIMHGITAHSHPYAVIGGPLSQMGFSTYGMDLRGHGLSEGPRGDIKSKEMFFEDVQAVLNFIRSKHDKVVLIGHSLGVVTSVMAANEFQNLVNGLILLSAARTTRDGAYPKRPLATTLKILFWSIIAPSKPSVHYYREGITGVGDPHFNFYYTLRFLKVISVKNFVFPESISYPVFVGVGDADPLFTIDGAKELFEEIPAESKEFGVLPGAKHAYFGENSFDPLFEWVEKTFK